MAGKNTNTSHHMFDLDMYQPLLTIFPELTNIQAVTAFLYVVGCNVEAIADIRSVSSSTVVESLNSAKGRLNVPSLHVLRSVVLSRLVISILNLININTR